MPCWGSPGPHPGSLQAHTWGVCVFQHALRQTPPLDSYCRGRYASYRNAFLSSHAIAGVNIESAYNYSLSPRCLALWLNHIAGSKLGLGLGFRLQTLWLHSIIQNFSHWFRSRSGSLSLSICIVQEYESE